MRKFFGLMLLAIIINGHTISDYELYIAKTITLINTPPAAIAPAPTAVIENRFDFHPPDLKLIRENGVLNLIF